MKYLLLVLAFVCLSTKAMAYGSIPWTTVHDEIQNQDKDLIALIDQTFDVSPSGGAMRPLTGEHAGERFAPYDFLAKLKGTKGDYVFSVTFEPTNEKTHSWSVKIQKK